MKKKILMLGSSLNVKGGMTTVVEGFLDNDFKSYKLHYIETHFDMSNIQKVIMFAISVIKIIFYILTNNVSIVHMHFSERGSFTRKNFLMKICKAFKRKTIIHMHGAEFKEFYNNSNDLKKKKIIKFLKKADRVLVLGESWFDFVRKLDQDINIEIMPNFVTCVNDKASYDCKDINIVFLAVLIKRKGIFDLVEAMEEILKDKELKDYNINVIIAGSGCEESAVKEKIDELGISDSFVFKGWLDVKQKNEILKKGQIFVLPSYNEGLPVSILEAMSYGLPIISTNVGSIEDAVINGYNGIIINPGNIKELINAISTLIKDVNLWEKFSYNSKYIVAKKYDKDTYFENIEKIYESIK